MQVFPQYGEKNMKPVVVATALLSCGLSMAQTLGTVISSVPVQQQFAVPHQVCTTEQVAVPTQKSGAGAAMGAIAGGAMGNAVGNGSGRAAATMIGIVGGAILGDRIEGQPPVQTQSVQTCTTHNTYEYRTVAYNVTYEYAAKRYTVQMPNDPGPTIELNIAPVGTSTPIIAHPAAVLVRPAPAVYVTPRLHDTPRYDYPMVRTHVLRGRWDGYRGY
jgi:uncharacterized protein YcfJ